MNGGVGSGQVCFIKHSLGEAWPLRAAAHGTVHRKVGIWFVTLPLPRGEVFQYTFSVLGLGLSAGRTEVERQ